LRILGIDPGYATVGYGIVDYEKNKFSVVGYGAVTTAAGRPIEERLLEIYNDMLSIIDTYHPDTIAMEELFFNTNAKTAINVGQARGVIMLSCAVRGIKPYEYTPLQVKQSVVGYGRAEKRQVMEMTRVLLALSKIPKPDDAADALAIAVCHAHSLENGNKLGTSGKKIQSK